LEAEGACGALEEAQNRPATLRYGEDESDLLGVCRRKLRPDRSEQELVRESQTLVWKMSMRGIEPPKDFVNDDVDWLSIVQKG